MHSKTIDADRERPTRFHYSSGLCGDVIINVPVAAVTTVPGEPDVVQVTVPGENLRALVLRAMRDEVISRLETMTDRELADLFAHRTV